MTEQAAGTQNVSWDILRLVPALLTPKPLLNGAISLLARLHCSYDGKRVLGDRHLKIRIAVIYILFLNWRKQEKLV
jgi:hypothetical protein